MKSTLETSRSYKKIGDAYNRIRKSSVFLIIFYFFSAITGLFLADFDWTFLPFIIFMWSSFLYISFLVKEEGCLVRVTKIFLAVWAICFFVVPVLSVLETRKPLSEALDESKFVWSFLAISIILFALLFVVFIKKIWTESIKAIRQRKWNRIVFFNGLLWLYSIWIFQYLYMGFGCLHPRDCLGGNQMTDLDSFYFSFSTLTTLGTAEIVPSGFCRILVGIEALTGFILISVIAGIIVVTLYKESANEGPP